MNKKKNLIIVILIIALAAAAWHMTRSDKRKIRKRFDLLSGYLLKEGPENPVIMALKVKNIGTLFDKRCLLEVEKYTLTGTYSPEEITSYAATARSRFANLELKFYDISIEFLEEKIAHISATATISGTLKSGEVINDAHEIMAKMKKAEKKWFFSQISVVEVLKR
ncbi:MAG: hypothetical protein IMF07_02455 [Proteobacteria bacterium]|nr:hypothetical protein [Pseudomonadota bacterium]